MEVQVEQVKNVADDGIKQLLLMIMIQKRKKAAYEEVRQLFSFYILSFSCIILKAVTPAHRMWDATPAPGQTSFDETPMASRTPGAETPHHSATPSNKRNRWDEVSQFLFLFN